jgi:hypothetical protein
VIEEMEPEVLKIMLDELAKSIHISNICVEIARMTVMTVRRVRRAREDMKPHLLRRNV